MLVLAPSCTSIIVPYVVQCSTLPYTKCVLRRKKQLVPAIVVFVAYAATASAIKRRLFSYWRFVSQPLEPLRHSCNAHTNINLRKSSANCCQRTSSSANAWHKSWKSEFIQSIEWRRVRWQASITVAYVSYIRKCKIDVSLCHYFIIATFQTWITLTHTHALWECFPFPLLFARRCWWQMSRQHSLIDIIYAHI